MERPDITEGYERRLARAAPPRQDDTPVLADQTGRRATAAEAMAVIAEVRAEIAIETAAASER